MHAVIIYSTPTCPYCTLAKKFMKEKNVAFTEINVADDENAAQEMIKKSGQMGVPVIVVGEQIIVGFDKSELERVLLK